MDTSNLSSKIFNAEGNVGDKWYGKQKKIKLKACKGHIGASYRINNPQGVAASCEGKFGFKSYAKAASSIRKVARVGAGRLNPYRCNSCGLYHVGSRY